MDIRKIKKLIELLEESNVAELEITEGEEAVKISRYGSQPPMPFMPAQYQVTPALHAASIAAPTSESEHIPVAASAPAGKVIRSPMVGTFYAASSPDTADFVSIGQEINIGDTVCIIEAMKMFNRIEAEFGGKVKEILVENGQPVEYDQALFILE